jgi:hypothetical protein
VSTPSYDEIKRQVERRYRRRALLIYHVIIAAAGLPAIWVVARPNTIVIFTITALWVGLLLLQAAHAFIESAKDREIERTWRRYYGDIDYEDFKPKRSFRLNDDAELEVIEDDQPERRYSRRE